MAVPCMECNMSSSSVAWDSNAS